MKDLTCSQPKVPAVCALLCTLAHALPVLQHEGQEERHSWFLEKIVVTDMQTMESWLFVCNNWLSRFHGDHRLYRDLRAARTEKTLRGNFIIFLQLYLSCMRKYRNIVISIILCAVVEIFT